MTYYPNVLKLLSSQRRYLSCLYWKKANFDKSLLPGVVTTIDVKQRLLSSKFNAKYWFAEFRLNTNDAPRSGRQQEAVMPESIV